MPDDPSADPRARDGLGDRAAEPAEDAVLLHGEQEPRPSRGVQHRGLVEGFDGVHVQDARRHPGGVQLRGGAERRMHHRSRRDDGQVVSAPVLDRLADLEPRIAFPVHIGILAASDAEVDGAGAGRGGAEGGSELRGVGGATTVSPAMLRVIARSSVAWWDVP